MALTVEIIDVKASDGGDNFKGRLHTISAKLILKDAGIIVFEQSFSELHKDIYLIAETMEKIRVKMDDSKKKYEEEVAMTINAEKEVAKMLLKLEATEVK